MLFHIDNEVRESHNDLNTIRKETSTILRTPSENQPTRHRLGAGVGLAALAAMFLFRAGVASGGSEFSGLPEIFSACHDKAPANAAKFSHLSNWQDVLTQFATEFSTNADEKSFFVKNELPASIAIQAEMASTQNRNRAVIQEQFNRCEQNFHLVRDFTHLFFRIRN